MDHAQRLVALAAHHGVSFVWVLVADPQGAVWRRFPSSDLTALAAALVAEAELLPSLGLRHATIH